MLRSRLVATLAVVLALFCGPDSSHALAQSCHAVDFHKPRDDRLHATLGALVAGYDQGDESGSYEGIFGGFGYHADWWAAELLLPAYRLAPRAQDDRYGLGDLVLTARGTVVRAREGKLSAGVELPVMLPTGSDARGLGMGHVMPMPGLWFSFVRAPVSLRLAAGYGQALGQMPASHHHTGSGSLPRPIVNPMNYREFEHAAALGLGLRRDFSVHARWFGGVPIERRDGVLRQIVALGITATLAAFELTFEVQRPVVNLVFDYKLVLQLGASF
jgi:hypothetical protein